MSPTAVPNTPAVSIANQHATPVFGKPALPGNASPTREPRIVPQQNRHSNAVSLSVSATGGIRTWNASQSAMLVASRPDNQDHQPVPQLMPPVIEPLGHKGHSGQHREHQQPLSDPEPTLVRVQVAQVHPKHTRQQDRQPVPRVHPRHVNALHLTLPAAPGPAHPGRRGATPKTIAVP